MIKSALAGLLWLVCIGSALAEKTTPDVPAPKALSYKILEQAKHNPNSFTQGWELVDGIFYESSGLTGISYITSYKPDNTPLQKLSLNKAWFAEGLTLLDNSLFVLTWQHGIALKIDRHNWQQQTQFTYQGEGWGLTHNNQQLIMSNGSDTLSFIDPDTFKTTRQITVRGGATQWANINELEYARGLIWANLWQTPYIIAIAPGSGQVVGLLDLSLLVRANTFRPLHESLNGIAYDKNRDAFWVTGKLWQNRYLLDIEPIAKPTKQPHDISKPPLSALK